MAEIIILLSILCILFLFLKSNKKHKELKQDKVIKNVPDAAHKKTTVQHKKSEHLASKAEQEFYKVLLDILPNQYVVHCQVSMMALVQPVNFKDNSKTWAKRVDFVITDRDTKVIAVIELDDSSHRQKKRQERDSYVNAAFAGHHKLLRFEAMGSYDPTNIASVIEREIGLECNIISEPVPKYG
ncbi:TPA: DUF2726 domain-containing protein [Vibrio parahaemolyticus]|uniref:DUF2726 domain-containing protein n=1 Tax=Vibrio alginolyticus TaxID=663 RepID=UPI001BD6D141|nr:DUF2726 domain-containing protein [Vibrio alginolyticus]EHK6025109.1 DUF2726 domain-containing protein [Vibrio parahaemolyticus]MBS9981212.1 DUF2726 domain-containing protein [Vibrio alginolyticus]